jgi:pimeloyl-ACP methyl ester carboxylesterase
LTNPWLVRQFLSSMVARKDAATSERAELLQRPQRRTGSTDAYAAWLPFLLWPDADALSRNADGYRSISRPVSLVWGEADTLAPIVQGRRLAQLIPGATLDTLPGVGHVPHIEAPQDTVALLRRQLERIAPTATQRNAPGRLDQERCKLGATL